MRGGRLPGAARGAGAECGSVEDSLAGETSPHLGSSGCNGGIASRAGNIICRMWSAAVATSEMEALPGGGFESVEAIAGVDAGLARCPAVHVRGVILRRAYAAGVVAISVGGADHEAPAFLALLHVYLFLPCSGKSEGAEEGDASACKGFDYCSIRVLDCEADRHEI